jgi:hypothetical protein
MRTLRLDCSGKRPGENFRVGLPGFEPGTSCSQSRRAAKLRYSPLLTCFQTSPSGQGFPVHFPTAPLPPCIALLTPMQTPFWGISGRVSGKDFRPNSRVYTVSLEDCRGQRPASVTRRHRCSPCLPCKRGEPARIYFGMGQKPTVWRSLPAPLSRSGSSLMAQSGRGRVRTKGAHTQLAWTKYAVLAGATF